MTFGEKHHFVNDIYTIFLQGRSDDSILDKQRDFSLMTSISTARGTQEEQSCHHCCNYLLIIFLSALVLLAVVGAFAIDFTVYGRDEKDFKSKNVVPGIYLSINDTTMAFFSVTQRVGKWWFGESILISLSLDVI
jgi:hypothetical protein